MFLFCVVNLVGIFIDHLANLENFLIVANLLGNFEILTSQALKYRSVTDIVRPIREIVRRGEETVGHSVQPKWN